jgi:hypothetical protein
MSRSYKKTPIFGNAEGSEKPDKRRWHKAYRRKSKQLINQSIEQLDSFESTIFPTEREISDVWLMKKDGKNYWNPKNIPYHLIQYFKKLMRK